jgi:membrane associated rhomboid family serine protease
MSGVQPAPEGTSDSDDFCYRHPDRQSFILCERCGRTICTECQTPAAVGVHCPECVKEGRASAPRSRPVLVRSARRIRSTDGPVVTYSLLGVTAFVFLLGLLPGSVLNFLAFFTPAFTARPWTVITSVFVQTSIFGLLLSGLALFLFGRILESLLGRWRFLALYLLSAMGGAAAVALTNPVGVAAGTGPVFFGLIAAMFIVQRGLGGNGIALVVIVVINFVFALIVGGAWQAYIGGLVVGALVGYVFMRTRAIRKAPQQRLLLGAVAVGLLILTFLGAEVF